MHEDINNVILSLPNSTFYDQNEDHLFLSKILKVGNKIFQYSGRGAWCLVVCGLWCVAGPLLAPIFREMLRYRSKWEIYSDLAPNCSDLVKHKGLLP